MLDGDVSLPFIFGTESDITTIVRKGTDELALSRFGTFCSGAGGFSSTRLDYPARVGVRAGDGLKRILPRSWFDNAIRRTAS